MADLRQRFGLLNQLEAPDLRRRIRDRPRLASPPEPSWHRFTAAAIALLLAAGGLAVVVRAFSRSERSPRPAAAPDNGAIAFTGGSPYAIWVVNPDGTGLRRLTQQGQLDGEFEPVWSPDGSRIAFRGYVDDPSLTGANYDVFVINADGSGLVNLTTAAEDQRLASSQGSPSWSPDGRLLAYDSDSGDANEVRTDLFVVHARGGQPQRITESPLYDFAPQWSPDGSAIAFNRLVKGSSSIHVVAPNGSEAAQLTQGDAFDQRPAWAPDGQSIAFTSDRSGENEVYVMDRDGSGEARISDLPSDPRCCIGSPVWSPDGRFIAVDVYEGGDWDIWLVSADGSGDVRLTDGLGDETSPVWAPDGTRVAYMASPIPASQEENAGTFDVWVVAPDGSHKTRLTQDAGGLPGGLDWQPLFNS